MTHVQALCSALAELHDLEGQIDPPHVRLMFADCEIQVSSHKGSVTLNGFYLCDDGTFGGGACSGVAAGQPITDAALALLAELRAAKADKHARTLAA